MKLRLYHYWRSSCSWRVRWGLSLKEVDCEMVAVDLLKGETESQEHKARNPLGYVPVLAFLEDTPNEKPGLQKIRNLGESMAILEWLEETYPKPSLLPGPPLQRARIRQLAEMINAGTQPLQNLNIGAHHSSDPEEQKQWNRHWIRNGLHAYEELVQTTSGRFSVGDTVTLADLCLIPQCYNAKRHDIPLSEFPRVEKIYEEALKTKACQKSAPDSYIPANFSPPQ